MERVTRWSPDTCGCVLECKWDDSIDPLLRTHTLSKVIKRCSIHRASNPIWDVVTEENTRKNMTFGKIQELKPALKSGDYHWTFDKDRVLVVDIISTGVSLTPTEKTQLESNINSNLGTNKVKFKV